MANKDFKDLMPEGAETKIDLSKLHSLPEFFDINSLLNMYEEADKISRKAARKLAKYRGQKPDSNLVRDGERQVYLTELNCLIVGCYVGGVQSAGIVNNRPYKAMLFRGNGQIPRVIIGSALEEPDFVQFVNSAPEEIREAVKHNAEWLKYNFDQLESWGVC